MRVFIAKLQNVTNQIRSCKQRHGGFTQSQVEPRLTRI